MNRSEPIHVLHVLGRMNRGGTEMRTLELMRCLDADRFKMSFCALSGEAGSLDAEVISLGGSIFPCKLNAQFPLTFGSLLREQKVDVVHSHVFLFFGFNPCIGGMEWRPAPNHAFPQHIRPQAVDDDAPDTTQNFTKPS